MKIVEEYKFFSKPLLKKANDAALREKRNKCINPAIVDSLPLDYVFYVTGFMYHKKNELRLTVIIDESGKSELLDVSVTRYQSLPTIRYFDDGNFDVKFSERPYPNGREWQEIEVKKPLRNQIHFRKIVLSAYNNCCSLCDMNEITLLRAAHILDVKNGGPDSIDNGICLCVNHEIAFDNGKLRINPDYSVFAPDGLGVRCNELKLPMDKNYYPSSDFLKQKSELIDKKITDTSRVDCPASS
ncbi:MAG: hypothetical protein A2W90_17340 [Bacteroidetes bacterium GWF2_42_66]|nr:MAG: hypothetical protein A2W92_21425 [Bacteroidetes bacterium GWA2_42_15]OFX97662.1 MAG: hypothetical protein A2W89_19475 [Bacteroidetes bacterium GWE2_42_39]OFY46910.1 MAG: hypothetical protein A2W90_17340 [Bacteroidetes bacterium GWF2_42_66]HBL75730.1 HNH endonuclease [Prolixibacteraceae bacterium]HCR92038.1 HNH endonuclease [Prolixibacteraceae bacterium]